MINKYCKNCYYICDEGCPYEEELMEDIQLVNHNEDEEDY